MFRLYHNLAKKSMFCLFLAIILISPSTVLAKIPNDPNYQKDIYNQINAPAAWDKTIGSRQVVVAIIDTGADIYNPDLNDNIWKNPLELEGNGKDDDNNGYIDDYFGWNFVEENNDVITKVDNTDDEPGAVSHGTVTAGLIGAVGNNERDGTGINWQVKMMPLRVLNNDGTGSEEALVRAIYYAMDKKVDVISMSFVTDDFLPATKNALRQAFEQGIVVVASAGNDGVVGISDMNLQPKYPICLDQGDRDNWILGVTSVDAFDQRSFFADYGRCVDITAPGQNIFSTERYAPAYGYKEEFGGPWKGNSFATPIVAGAAALIKSVRPDWEPGKIVQTLLDTTDDIKSANPLLLGELGRGRLNLGKAVDLALADKILTISSATHVFSFRQDHIWRDDVLFSFLEQSKILALESADVNNDQQKELVILHERAGFYFLRILTSDSELWKEFSLGSTDSKNIINKRLAVVASGESSWGQIAIAQWNQKKKVTIITLYNLDGQQLGKVQITAKLFDWKTRVDGVAIVKPSKKGQIEENWNWAGHKL